MQFTTSERDILIPNKIWNALERDTQEVLASRLQSETISNEDLVQCVDIVLENVEGTHEEPYVRFIYEGVKSMVEG